MPPPPRHYDDAEVRSALQKSIRRGLEEDALYWAAYLVGISWEQSLWKRLLIIASEDIGIADSSVAVLVRSLYENWKEFSKMSLDDRNAARLFIMHAVIALVRAPKSRIVDHATGLACKRDGLDAREIPSYAIDKHTRQGQAMGRGYKFFFDEGGKLENCTLRDPYETRARTLALAQEQEEQRKENPQQDPQQAWLDSLAKDKE